MLLWNRTDRKALRLCLWFRFGEAAFSPRNYRNRQRRFVVITLMSLLLPCMWQYCYAMLMRNASFQTYHNHGEMRAFDGGAVTLPRCGSICDKSPTFCAITHRTYFILFQPVKAYHHWKVECHLLHVSHLHQVTLSFQIALISSLSKVSPFPG